MSESNVFMVLYFNEEEVKVAGVYPTSDDAVSRMHDLEEDGIDEESIWMEEYVMGEDI